MVSFARWGKYLHVSGGLLAADEHKEELLAEFLANANHRREVVTFYNIVGEDLPLFRKYGFQVTAWGQEALVDLPSCRWEGKAYEWIRRQSNYCQRQQLEFSEVARDDMTDAEWLALVDQLCEICPAPLMRKSQAGEIKFLEGAFDPNFLARKRIFIARREAGQRRIEGFLVCNPAQDGAMWVFETYRQRPGAVRGTITYLMHQAMRCLNAKACRWSRSA